MSEQQSKAIVLKHIMGSLGAMLILVGSAAGKADNLPFFFMGLALLAIQVFEFKGVAAVKLVMGEIILSLALGIAAMTQLFTSKSFGTPQAFLVVLLLGVTLLLVESVRKFAELE